MKSLVFAASLFAANFDKPAFEKDLATLAASSRLEGERCDKALKADRGDIIRQLADYPGLPPSTVKVFAKIQKEIPEDVEIDLSSTFALGDCRTIGYFKLAKRVAHAKGERKKAALAYLRKDLDGTMTLLQTMVHLDALREFDEAGVIPLDKRGREIRTALHLRAEKLRDELRTETPTVKQLRREFNATDALREELRLLLASV